MKSKKCNKRNKFSSNNRTKKLHGGGLRTMLRGLKFWPSNATDEEGQTVEEARDVLRARRVQLATARANAESEHASMLASAQPVRGSAAGWTHLANYADGFRRRPSPRISPRRTTRSSPRPTTRHSNSDSPRRTTRSLTRPTTRSTISASSRSSPTQRRQEQENNEVKAKAWCKTHKNKSLESLLKNSAAEWNSPHWIEKQELWSAPLHQTSPLPLRRVNSADGNAYTRQQFVEEYGGIAEWEAAVPEDEATTRIPEIILVPYCSEVLQGGIFKAFDKTNAGLLYKDEAKQKVLQEGLGISLKEIFTKKVVEGQPVQCKSPDYISQSHTYDKDKCYDSKNPNYAKFLNLLKGTGLLSVDVEERRKKELWVNDVAKCEIFGAQDGLRMLIVTHSQFLVNFVNYLIDEQDAYDAKRAASPPVTTYMRLEDQRAALWAAGQTDATTKARSARDRSKAIRSAAKHKADKLQNAGCAGTHKIIIDNKIVNAINYVATNKQKGKKKSVFDNFDILFLVIDKDKIYVTQLKMIDNYKFTPEAKRRCENISAESRIFMLMRHCYACHNTLGHKTPGDTIFKKVGKQLEKKYKQGTTDIYSNSSMCINNEDEDEAKNKKITGLMGLDYTKNSKALDNLGNLFMKYNINRIGSSYVVRAVVTAAYIAYFGELYDVKMETEKKDELNPFTTPFTPPQSPRSTTRSSRRSSSSTSPETPLQPTRSATHSSRRSSSSTSPETSLQPTLSRHSQTQSPASGVTKMNAKSGCRRAVGIPFTKKGTSLTKWCPVLKEDCDTCTGKHFKYRSQKKEKEFSECKWEPLVGCIPGDMSYDNRQSLYNPLGSR